MVQILYTPNTSGVMKMVQAASECFCQGECFATEILPDMALPTAELYLIGFYLSRDVLPYSVVSLLEKLEGQQLCFFACGPLCEAGQFRARFEKQLEAFLPDRCKHHGFFLCSSEPLQEEWDRYIAQLNGDEAAIEQLRTLTVGRPDQNDLKRLQAFVMQLKAEVR